MKADIATQQLLDGLDVVAFYTAHVTDFKTNGAVNVKCKCPFHDGDGLSINNKNGLWKCHSKRCEKSGSPWEFLMLKGYGPAQIRSVLADFQRTGTIFTGKPKAKKLGRIAKAYDYADERGTLIFQVVRYEPKTFRQRRPDGNGGWIWDLNDTRRVLYGLPGLIVSTASGWTIYVTEGERDADAINNLDSGGDFFATTNPGGAGKWLPEYSETLRGARVIIVADNDEPGRKHAMDVRAALTGVAASVQIVTAKVGKDAFDHLAAGHGLADFEPMPEVETPSHAEAHLTDLGNARRFVAMHGDVIRFVPAWKQWLVWDGRCWRRDSLGTVFQLARKTVAAMYADAAKEADVDKRRKLVTFALASESEKRLQSMVSLAETEIGVAVHEHELDRDPWLLNVANGTLDLRTVELRAPNQADLLTYALDVPYDAAARCPLWMMFLTRAFNANDELHAFVQRAMGYTLTGTVREQTFFLLHGTGKNGKTVFIETVRAVLGDFARMARFESFLVKRGDQIPSDIARLKGARFVTAVETQDGRRLDEAMVKQVTGGDVVTARFHYQGEFEFKPTFKLFLTSNYKPVIQGQDLAIWRRVKLIPFTVTIPEEERDLDLVNKLAEELPGILVWMVEGARLWLERGLGTCDAVEEHTRQYQSEQDTVGRWLDDNCAFSKQATVSKSDLYAEYKKTTVEAGETPLSDKKFSRRMREIHPEIEDDRVGTKRFWRGVGLA